MNSITIIKKIIKNPRGTLVVALDKISFLLRDEIYLKMKYRIIMRKKLNLKNPQTFNEKLQWLKLYDRKPKYTLMVDKVKVKEYVASMIGEEYIIPTLGIWERAEDVDFDTLPDKFVIKCNHNSGVGMYICRDKSNLDEDKVREGLRQGLKENYYLHGREWPYKNVQRRIIAEKFLEDKSGSDLKDYKFLCFNGQPHIMFVASERNNPNEETKFDFFDMNCKHIEMTNGHPNSHKEIKCPVSFNKMQELAAILSQGIPHIRVDFYDINGKIYFGELTFSHWSGMVPFNPDEWDTKLGNLICLP